MTLTRLLAVLAREPFGFPPAVVADMTLAQVKAVLTDPKSHDDSDDESADMTARDYSRLRAIYNCWPAWLEEKDWRDTRPGEP